MKINFAEEILANITMHNLLEKYHKTGRHNRTSCPFHNGKDNNFSYNDKVYHCFVCGVKGNIITFVKEYFGLDFMNAISKLNDDFGLGLPINSKMTLRQRKDFLDKAKVRERQKEQRRIKEENYIKLHNSLWDEWTRLDNNRRDYAPKSLGDDFHPLYVEAVNKIDYQSYLIDSLL